MQLVDIGFLLIIAGFITIILGFLLLFKEKSSNTDIKREVSAGGVIFIGPIPIVFGTSRKILIISLIFAILILLLFLASVITLL